MNEDLEKLVSHMWEKLSSVGVLQQTFKAPVCELVEAYMRTTYLMGVKNASDQS